MAISKLDLNTLFVTLDEDTPAGLALSALLHEAFIVVKGQNANGQDTHKVLVATALSHVVESTSLKDVPVGSLPTDTLQSSLDIDDAKGIVANNADFVFLVLDEEGKPLGVLPPEGELIMPQSTGQIEVQCMTCGKWVIVSSTPGAKLCPIYGHECAVL